MFMLADAISFVAPRRTCYTSSWFLLAKTSFVQFRSIYPYRKVMNFTRVNIRPGGPFMVGGDCLRLH